MIVVSNTFIPANKRRRVGTKNQTQIAQSEAGDVAYYTTAKQPPVMLVNENLEEEDDEESADEYDADDFLSSKPQQSFTGADWKPFFSDRMTMFIAGTPGAGKSYLAKQMINLLPDTTDILLFTALEEKDGNFDDLNKEHLFKIKMVPEVLSTITLKAIREKSKSPQTILLFDDVDKIRDPKIQQLTFAIMNDALANGRGHEKHDGKGDIHVLCTSHSLNDYNKTKYTFENSNYVALFPGTTPALQMYRMFDKLGLDKDLCKYMMKLARQQKIRSIIVHKVVPMYIIFGNKIMLL